MVLFVKPFKKIIYEPFTVAVAAIRMLFLKPVIFLENVWRFYLNSQKIKLQKSNYKSFPFDMSI